MNQESNLGSINVVSYPQQLVNKIPLPSWLTWIIFWQLLFVIDYLINWNTPYRESSIGVFAAINLFFASVCIVIIYCSRVLINLFPHLLLFVEGDKSNLRQWYENKLKSAYEGLAPVIAGVLISITAVLSIHSLVLQLTPSIDFLLFYRIGYLALGFFFLGVSIWALIRVILIPMELIRMKVKVSINQISGNGLQQLGASYLKMSLSITVSFMLIVTTAILAPFENNLIVLVWLGLAALLIFGFFLLPQMGIHRVMVNEKTNRMSTFTHHLEEAMDRTLKDPSAENMQRLKELFEVQNHLKGMNEWPFDFNSIWQLITALIIPIVLAAVEIFFKS